MALSPGTALQNGQYVIDALLETAPNGDLYWGTHIATGTQVYIQVSPLSADSPDVSTLIAHLQGVSFAAQAPCPKPFQIFYGAANTLCFAMGLAIGRPWTLAYRTHAPMPLEQALNMVRTVAEGALWLADRGISGIDLSLNRIWTTAESNQITLTGLPQQYIAELQTVSAPASEMVTSTVPSLAQLLFSALSGNLLQTDTQQLARTLQQQQPHLSQAVIEAIHPAIAISRSLSLEEAIREWLSLLPDTDPSTAEPELLQAAASQSAQPVFLKRFWGLYPALGITALMAAIGGGTLGTAWRLNAGNLPGDIQLEPNQSFPPQSDWSGDDPKADLEPPDRFTWESQIQEENWHEPNWETTEPELEWVPEIAEEPEQPSEETEFFDEESPKVPAPWASEAPSKNTSTDKITPEDVEPEATLETFIAPSANEEEFSNVYDTAEPDHRASPKTKWAPAPTPAPTSEG